MVISLSAKICQVILPSGITRTGLAAVSGCPCGMTKTGLPTRFLRYILAKVTPAPARISQNGSPVSRSPSGVSSISRASKTFTASAGISALSGKMSTVRSGKCATPDPASAASPRPASAYFGISGTAATASASPSVLTTSSPDALPSELHESSATAAAKALKRSSGRRAIPSSDCNRILLPAMIRSIATTFFHD